MIHDYDEMLYYIGKAAYVQSRDELYRVLIHSALFPCSSHCITDARECLHSVLMRKQRGVAE